MRPSKRDNAQLRNVVITRNYTKYAEGAVLIEYGDTKVICTATVEEQVPLFLQGKEQGWISAEYSMLPRATHSRNKRDAIGGKGPNPRAQEISRLIGRSLRACVDMQKLGSRQILIDCDVIQADGGTRTASITGAFVALYDALKDLMAKNKISQFPIIQFLAAVSVGIYNKELLLDLDYIEDCNCDADVNIVMLEDKSIIEIQGTAEGASFTQQQMFDLIKLAEGGISDLIKMQKRALE
jgi:ribonuclease PH